MKKKISYNDINLNNYHIFIHTLKKENIKKFRKNNYYANTNNIYANVDEYIEEKNTDLFPIGKNKNMNQQAWHHSKSTSKKEKNIPYNHKRNNNYNNEQTYLKNNGIKIIITL